MGFIGSLEGRQGGNELQGGDLMEVELRLKDIIKQLVMVTVTPCNAAHPIK